MKTFIINLGLGNSTWEKVADKNDRRTSAFITADHFASLLGIDITHEWAEGEYEGKPEETMVITVTTPSVGAAYDFATVLARVFTQQCVAIYDVEAERGDLVWSSDVDDRPYTFDPSFFIMPTTVRDRITSRLPKA